MIQIKMKLLIQVLMIACVSMFFAGCEDSQKEEPVEVTASGAPRVLSNTLKVKGLKQTYVITGIGLSSSNKVAIINNQVLKPGRQIAPGVVLEDVQPTYAIICVGDTKHLLRPEDIQREIDKQTH